jgi:Ser/Thr protein kinase RdoA (MazF antagonist)
MHGGDLGLPFFNANVRDAIRSLEALRPPAIRLTRQQESVRLSLMARLCRLFEEQPMRAQALLESGGPETLLHGDLWTMNTFVIDTPHGLQARLIDWDHAGVGPASYDLSTFLMRFPVEERSWILDRYRAAVERCDGACRLWMN